MKFDASCYNKYHLNITEGEMITHSYNTFSTVVS